MMELIMSRVWLVIAGMMMTGAVLYSFGALNDNDRYASEMEGAEALARSIESLGTSVPEGTVVFEAKDLLPAGGGPLRVYNGSIWIGERATARAVDLPTPVVLISDGARVDHLIVDGGDVLIIRSIGTLEERVVQLEKVSAMNLMVSTNVLHSSFVL